MATDAFGRLRTSEPFTTFNYYPTPAYNDTSDNDIWVRDSSSGSILYDSSNNLLEIVINPGPGNNKFAYRGTKMPMDYQPGKSRLVLMSGVMMTPVPPSGEQIYSRMGLMNIASPIITDGVWFEVDGSNSTLNWCESIQDGSGSYRVNKIPDSSWNIDTFDGTGPSGKILSFSNMDKVILVVIDQEWLGVGRLRCGFNIGGVTYYAHAFTHESLSYAYTSTPLQKLGYEILTGTTGTMPAQSYKIKQICCSCMSEGGFFPLGTRNSISTDFSGVLIADANINKNVILGLKLKTGEAYKGGILRILGIDVSLKSGNQNNRDVIKYTLEIHSSINNTTIGAVSPTPTFINVPNSITSYHNTGTESDVTTDGYIIHSGFVSSHSTISFSSNDFETLLKRAIIASYDTLYLTAQGDLSANAAVYASIDFIEYL
jgi:hypothetical protein